MSTRTPMPKPPYALDGAAPPLHRQSPTLGQHNQEVLGHLLGLTPKRIKVLADAGIIGDRAV